VSRVRGLAAWSPRAATKDVLAQVKEVLTEYAEYLPLTVRQIFYRLVGNYDYEKTEQAYERLGGYLNRGRRAGEIAFRDIRDDGGTEHYPAGFWTKAPGDFWQSVLYQAEKYMLDRRTGQQIALEQWSEAAGMAPMLFDAVAGLGVPVFSSGGFDSLTAKWEAALRIMDESREGRQTVILHVGDYDPSGESIYTAVEEDVTALVRDENPAALVPEFVRVAVTPEQIEEHNLPTRPPKKTDKRAWSGTETVQAEALPPDALVAEVRQAVESRIDHVQLEAVKAEAAEQRAEIIAVVESLLGEQS
jgi:hypothetical protein